MSIRTRHTLLALLLVSFLGTLTAGTASASPGDPDAGFGKRGSSQPRLGSSSGQIAYDTAVQPDGRIVMVGRTASGGSALAARYLPDGSPDESFGSGGFTQIEGIVFDSVTLDPSGRIVVAGHDGDRAVVVRLLADGNLDPGFATGGIHSVRFDPGGLDYEEAEPESPRLETVGVLDDGSILAAGRGGGCLRSCDWMLLLHLDGDGNPVPVRGEADGTWVGYAEDLAAIDLLPGGSLVTAVRESDSDGYDSWDYTNVSLYEPPAPDGSIERRWRRSFDSEIHPPGSGGKVLPTADGGFYLVSGSVIFKGLADGPDPEFGEKGVYGFGAGRFRLGSWNRYFHASDLAVDGDGRLLVAGLITNGSRSGRAFLARLQPDGKPDPTFSNDGLAINYGWVGTDGSGFVHPRVLDKGDGYLLTGTARQTGQSRFALRAIQGGSGPEATCDGRKATWIGTPKRDYLTVDSGVIVTGEGKDEVWIATRSPKTVVCAGAGDDRVVLYGGKALGGPGNDRIEGTSRKDKRTKELLISEEEIHGGPGIDQLNGLAGDDRIFGDAGQDTILGGDGDDDLFGGRGNDEIAGEGDNDHLIGGPGKDDLDGGPRIRPRSYYSGVLGRTRAEITRVGGKIILFRINAWNRCDDRWADWTWSRIGDPIPIGKNGRIRYDDSSSPSWSEKLEARLRGKSIKGRYMSYLDDDYFGACWTGKDRWHNWVGFRADFVTKRVQLTRQ